MVPNPPKKHKGLFKKSNLHKPDNQGGSPTVDSMDIEQNVLENEKKEYFRLKKKESRERLKYSKESSGIATQGFKPCLKSMTKKELKTHLTTYRKNLRAKRKSEKMGSDALKSGINETAETIAEPPAESRKKIKEMNVVEKRAYVADSQRKLRKKKHAIMEQSSQMSNNTSVNEFSEFYVADGPSNSASVSDTQTTRKRTNSCESNVKDDDILKKTRIDECEISDTMTTITEMVISSPSPSDDKSKMNTFGCRLRIGLVDLFQLETECTVIPHYGSVDFSNSKDLATQHLKRIQDEDEKEDYVDFLATNPIPEIIPEHYAFDKVQLHIQAPMVQDNKFTLITEAGIRATYISCLHKANQNGCRSIGFPRIGRSVHPKKAIFLAIQSVFAFFKSIEHSNLELIYVVTNRVAEYDEMVEYLSYVREFDFGSWTLEQYLKYEDHLLAKMKMPVSFSTIPGTDLVWRSLRSNHTKRQKIKEIDVTRKIHKIMCQTTSIPFSKFVFDQDSVRGRILTTRLITGIEKNEKTSRVIISLNYPMEHVCGSNAALRNLWIISFYILYYRDGSDGNIDLSEESEEFQYRKELSSRLKFLHKEVLKEWNRIVKYLPVKCECIKLRGYHEDFAPFSTSMSLRDDIFEKFVLQGKTLLISEDSIKDMGRLRTGFFPTPPSTDSTCKKVHFVRSVNQYKLFVDDNIIDWHENRKEYIQLQMTNMEQVMTTLKINDDSFKTGIETPHEMFFDPKEYDDHMDDGYFCNDGQEKMELEEALKAMESAEEEYEKLSALQKVESCNLSVKSKRFSNHLQNEARLETAMRNRLFRQMNSCLQQVDMCWLKPNGELNTADQFMAILMEKRGLVVEDLPEINDSDPPKEIETDPAHDNLFRSYPKCVHLGPLSSLCYFCGSAGFEMERVKSCCKNGAIWIPPIKLLPPEIEQVFQSKFRFWLIATNAAFSMASVRYSSVKQAAHGVNALKLRGTVSLQPSALHPNDPNRPRYANFIVLGNDNEKIASERFALLRKGNKKLAVVFEKIQEYLDRFNRLYDSFKSMLELEIEYLGDCDEPDAESGALRFRIVSPTELDEKDLKALAEHMGVYARPSRIEKGYITVAYTFNSEGTDQIPRGLMIYPRNPSGQSQMPLSIYSDLCDQMSYPLFHPEGTGGYGLHKYPRWTEKGSRPSHQTRIQTHIKELKSAKENPRDYYISNGSADELENESQEPMDVDEMDSGSGHNQSQSSLKSDTNQVNKDEVEHQEIGGQADEEGEIDDPIDMNDDKILSYGVLEDLQEVPIDGSVGQQPNYEMIERNGDVYPIINKRKRTVDIPYVSGNPFGSESDDEMGDGPVRNPLNDGFNTYEQVIREEEEERETQDHDTSYANRQHQVDGGSGDSETIIKNLSLGRSKDTLEKPEEVIGEEVCYGDEFSAEPLALGRNNDGVKVQNIGQRHHVSMAECYNFVLQERKEIPCRYQGKAGPLGQLIVIDWACRIREARMAALTTKRAEFARVANRNKVFQFYQKMVRDNFKGSKKLGMLVTMPSTVPGTAKYQRELVMSAVTISNKLGSPHLFLTFTGNPNWAEIKEKCKEEKCQWADIPKFVCNVFKNKLELFLDDVVGKKAKSSTLNGKLVREPGIFGAVKWFTYSVEFQQRGMPHVHLLLSLEKPITNAEEVNRIISAEVPELPTDSTDPQFEDKLRYYNCVKGLMTHFPCQNDPTSYCNEGKKHHWKKCCKGFPHDKCPDTVMCDNHYPKYKRTSTHKFSLMRRGVLHEAGSEYVVAHNPYLLLKYGCHINVEVVSSIKTMKYMFKYIFKGSDRVLLEAKDNLNKSNLSPDAMTLRGNVFAPANMDPGKLRQRQKETEKMMEAGGVEGEDYVALNDCSYMMDMAAMTACEAYWRIAGFQMHGCSHIVHRGYIHEEGNDVFYVKRGVSAKEAEEMLMQKSKGMMEAWFEANRNPQKLHGENRTTQDLTLTEMFKYYKFDTKSQKFVFRKKNYSDRILGRIQAPQPRWLELTATRILAQHVTGPQEWKDLRSYRGVEYKTCLDAARARRLMNGEQEWDDALNEVARYESAVQCRRFFASILLHSAPANPADLFERHWEDLVEDRSNWSSEQKIAHALRHIQFLLANHGMKLQDFELGDMYDEDNLPCIDPNDDHDNPEAVPLNKSDHLKIAVKMWKKLNKGQKIAVKRALGMDRESGKSRMMFVEGAGGTGKTFIYTTIYHFLKARGKNVICLAHTGQAASLLPYGCTAHRKCSIPLEVSDNMVCRVSAYTTEGDALKNTDAVMWDEISMSDRRIVMSTSNLFKDLKDNDLPFGGVMMIFGGDWRQILPIVEGVQGPAVVGYTLKNSAIWNQIEKFSLTENQRAIEDPEFAELILKIGDGAEYVDAERLLTAIPEKFIERRSETKLVEWVFPDVNDVEATKNAAVLTMDNKTALRLNEMVLDRLDGDERVFISTDVADKNTGISTDPEIFARETPSGMPPHRLRLKIGAQVVLLRNLSVEHGLCNGTRLTVKEFGDDVILCSMNNKTSRSPETVYLHRTRMSPTGKGADSCGFTRLQYPIRLSYACTVNKSQGMTLSKCGLVLHSSVFSHGQLYVAMSRVRRSENFKLWHYKRNDRDDYHFLGGMLIRNVVYREALTEPE